MKERINQYMKTMLETYVEDKYPRILYPLMAGSVISYLLQNNHKLLSNIKIFRFYSKQLGFCGKSSFHISFILV